MASRLVQCRKANTRLRSPTIEAGVASHRPTIEISGTQFLRRFSLKSPIYSYSWPPIVAGARTSPRTNKTALASLNTALLARDFSLVWGSVKIRGPARQGSKISRRESRIESRHNVNANRNASKSRLKSITLIISFAVIKLRIHSVNEWHML